MADRRAALRTSILIYHGVAALALALIAMRTGTMAVMSIVVGALIGAASAAAIPGRPIALYAAFGVLMSFVFWVSVAAIRQGTYLDLLPALLLLAGSAWLLSEPAWPPLIFTCVIVAGCLGLAVVGYQRRFENDFHDAETITHSVMTIGVLLSVGLIYAALGFAEVKLGASRKKKSKPRVVAPPSAVPMI